MSDVLMRCTRCGEVKPEDLFDRNRAARSGRDPRCKACRKDGKARSRELNPPAPETLRGYARRYKERHPERVAAADRRRNLRKFGITPEEYDRLTAAQAGRCAVCRQPETALNPRTGAPKVLAVDHCHRRGGVRGLLCQNCNTALGLLGDDPSRLAAAIAYITQGESDE